MSKGKKKGFKDTYVVDISPDSLNGDFITLFDKTTLNDESIHPSVRDARAKRCVIGRADILEFLINFPPFQDFISKKIKDKGH